MESRLPVTIDEKKARGVARRLRLKGEKRGKRAETARKQSKCSAKSS